GPVLTDDPARRAIQRAIAFWGCAALRAAGTALEGDLLEPAFAPSSAGVHHWATVLAPHRGRARRHRGRTTRRRPASHRPARATGRHGGGDGVDRALRRLLHRVLRLLRRDHDVHRGRLAAAGALVALAGPCLILESLAAPRLTLRSIWRSLDRH